jgi:DNA-binding MarR family transcriptional regulator
LENLAQLVEKGWIRCYAAPENEIFDALPLTDKGKTYYYLATKEGLLNHNTL